MKIRRSTLYLFIFLAFILLFSSKINISLADDCNDVAPGDAPNFYSISMASSTANLYFVQPSSEFDGYIISYGLTSSADNYSVKYPMSSINGANSYSVNNLFPNTNYYFKVRAVKGCAAGPWSQTLYTNLKGAGNLPETGPSWTPVAIGIAGAGLVILGGLLFLLFL